MGRIDTAIIVVAALVSLASCGPVDKLGFTPVEGRVTLDGKPLEIGELRFVPDADKGNAGPMSTGPLGNEGRFRLRGPGTRIGAIPGPHRVYLVSPDPYAASEPMILIDGTFTRPDGAAELVKPARGLIPTRFLALATAGLTADVVPGKPNTIDFDLQSPKPAGKASTP
jgi:hypothetical protein